MSGGLQATVKYFYFEENLAVLWGFVQEAENQKET